MKSSLSQRLLDRGFSYGLDQQCVLCGRVAGARGGYIPQPVDRRPAGRRCGWCYRRYLRKYFPEAGR